MTEKKQKIREQKRLTECTAERWRIIYHAAGRKKYRRFYERTGELIWH